MAQQGAQRKLAAILSVDAVGYSLLMADDEEATVETITRYRKEMGQLISQYHGRVVDSPGDNLLAEFASVVDAVRCALEIQERLALHNSKITPKRRMHFRIGINLGDVIIQGNRIYGDGVNIAARIESLAEPGGICLSRSAHEQVKNKLQLNYEFLGSHRVKNIAEPVKIYRVDSGPEKAGGPEKAPLQSKKPFWQHRVLWAAGAVFLLAFIVWIMWGQIQRHVLVQTSAEKADLAIPSKPSIVVLPFKNLSGDRQQEYFVDGITNDIITDLSKFRELLVIASNSSFTYKGKPIKFSQLKRELRVRYILEGSVQRSKDKVRINVRLIDATSGGSLWAERYNRSLHDLFALQDKIIQSIVASLAIKIDEAERARVRRIGKESLAAYEYLLRGRNYFRLRTRQANSKARQMFRKALKDDPHFAYAFVGLAQTYLRDFALGWTPFPIKDLDKAKAFAKQALSLEETNPDAHLVMGSVFLYRGKYNLAANELKRAIELNPNYALSHAKLGELWLYSGYTDKALKSLETARVLNPHFSPRGYMILGIAYYLKGRYQDCIKLLQLGLSKRPNFVGNHIVLAAAYAQAGRQKEALREAAKVHQLHPFFKLKSYGSSFRNHKDRARMVEGLRKAGLR